MNYDIKMPTKNLPYYTLSLYYGEYVQKVVISSLEMSSYCLDMMEIISYHWVNLVKYAEDLKRSAPGADWRPIYMNIMKIKV
jgi:hypothetical protein